MRNKANASNVPDEGKGLNVDLQRVLNAAAERVGNWIGERQALAKHLEGIRETAGRLLAQLGNDEETGRGSRKGRSGGKKRRRSKLSPEGRAAIVAAQKARWARVRKAKEK